MLRRQGKTALPAASCSFFASMPFLYAKNWSNKW